MRSNLFLENAEIKKLALRATISIVIALTMQSSVGADEKVDGNAIPAFPFHNAANLGHPELTGKSLDAWTEGEKDFRALDYKAAIAQFKEVVALKPDFSRGHERLGSALAANGEYDEAAAEMRKAIDLNKKDYLPHLILGRIILVKSGEDAGTVEAQKAYDIDPWSCAAFLDFANKDRFDPQKWFVLANYWKEMRADAKALGAKPTAVKSEKKAEEACCPECAKNGGMGNAEACAKKAGESLPK